MNPEQPDHELDEHLAGKSAVSRLYQQLAHETPGTELDARIRRAARQQLATRKSRWLLPMSAAAVVILAMGVFLQLQLEGISPVPQEMKPEKQEDSEASAPVAAPAPAAGYSLESAAPADSAQGNAPAAKRAEAFPGEDSRSLPPAVTPPMPQGPAMEQSQPDAVDEVLAEPSRQQAAPATDGAAPATRAERRADALTPKDRLARIRELRLLGRDREADDELAAFRERYPDYPLPADMQ